MLVEEKAGSANSINILRLQGSFAARVLRALTNMHFLSLSFHVVKKWETGLNLLWSHSHEQNLELNPSLPLILPPRPEENPYWGELNLSL